MSEILFSKGDAFTFKDEANKTQVTETKSGIYCPQCFTPTMEKVGGKWVCSECKNEPKDMKGKKDSVYSHSNNQQ